MNRNTALLTLAAAATTGIAPVAAAEPYNPDLVSADARWVIHVDVEAIVRSEIGRFILDNVDDARNALAELQGEIGLNPARDVLGVTVYGQGDPEEMGATIVATTTGAVDVLLDHVVANEDSFQQIGAEGDTRFYAGADGDEPFFVAVYSGNHDATRTLVMSPVKDLMTHGLAVATGKAPSVRRAAVDGMDIRPGDGSFFFVLATVLPDMLDDEAASFVVRHAKQVLVDVGESQGNLMADLALTTETPADAQNVAAVFQGIIALGHIAAASDPELRQLMPMLGGVRAVSDGAHVLVHAAVPIGDILETLRSVAENHNAPGF